VKRILLVEDEPGLILTLTDRLVSEGYAVETASNGRDGLLFGLEKSFDLIILDVMLPHKNGFDVCRDLRQQKVFTPILMLTAKGETIDKVLGLKLGADDYLTKPFEVIELLARIEALLRRSSAKIADKSDEIYSFGNVAVDFRRAEVRRDDEIVELSALEFKLLQYLIEHRGFDARRTA
jgi:two-component system, OmpR family, alkaline phosphatase synthesis response regulator PhoP